MRKWTSWKEISPAIAKDGTLNDYGIYQIRLVDKKGKVIPIGRFVKIDQQGLIYIGRSGFRLQRTGRTIANRIKEFVNQNHSGGITYALAQKVLRKQKKFSEHRLQVRGMFLPDNEIDRAEKKALRDYFAHYAELPPCNSAFPKDE